MINEGTKEAEVLAEYEKAYAMKEILVLRHANWNLVDDKLTDESREACRNLRATLGPFTIVLSSPAGRTQETAELLSGQKPKVDDRAAILKSPPELSAKVQELRKTHPFGVAGAIISIPELREPLQKQGEALKGLLVETLNSLEDDQRALVVSHDGTMVALEKVQTDSLFDQIDHTFAELEGFRVNENLELTRL
jgi:broad specificity phosphatase PhoE